MLNRGVGGGFRGFGVWFAFWGFSEFSGLLGFSGLSYSRVVRFFKSFQVCFRLFTGVRVLKV